MLTALLAVLLSGQTASSTIASDPALRAALAAERAARAAEAAAESAAKVAAMISGTPQAAALAAPAAPAPSKWEATVGLSFIWLAGNSETLTFSSVGAVRRKTPDWTFGITAAGAYGQAVSQISGSGSPEVTALNAQLAGRFDLVLNSLLNLYVAANAETDHVKSIELRVGPEAGVALNWYEDKDGDFVKTALRTDLGLRYTKELRFQYYPNELNLDDVDLISPRLGLAFRYAASKEIIFTEDAELLPNVLKETKVDINSAAKLAIKLTGALSFATGFGLKYDSGPAPGKKNLDTTVTLGLEATF